MRNWKMWGVIVVYAMVVVAQIHWGIPGPEHPFTYQMDEWHSLQSIRYLFNYRSVNIEGTGYVTVLFYVLAGVWLIPFWLAGFINPPAIKSVIDNLPMQFKLFEVLRLNTLAWGILALIMLYKLTRDWKAVALFAFTPIWLALSGLFKHDIAVAAATLTTLYFCLGKRWKLAGVITGLAMGIKISLLPLAAIYVGSGILFKRRLVIGVVIMLAAFLLTGIPDIFWKSERYLVELKANLVTSTSQDGNIKLGMPVAQYLIGHQFGYIFGYFLYGLFWVSLVILLLKRGKNREEILILGGLVVFGLSLVPLGLGAGSNRALVLLPFMVLVIIKARRWPAWLLAMVLTAQIWQSANILAVKFAPDVRQVASRWMLTNLPKETIVGVENIPIYQYLPDAVMNGSYKFRVIDGKLPEVVIVTRWGNLSKQDLLARLNSEGYVEKAVFRPKIWGSTIDFELANLIPTPMSISFYFRHGLGVD
ncbi:MAG: hypothetical protein AAB887_02170 [Patescibacteria group bacterium]